MDCVPMPPTLDQLVQEGNAYEDNDDDSRAQDCYEQARQQYPQSARPLINLGNLALKNDDLDRARDLYQRAIEVEPGASSFYSLANVLMQIDEYIPAIANYQRALEIRPEWLDASIALGNAYLLSGQHASAERQLWPILNQDNCPQIVRTLLAQSVLPRSTRDAITILNASEDHSVEQLMILATLERVFINHDRSFAALLRAWQMEPNNINILAALIGQSSITPSIDGARFGALLNDAVRKGVEVPIRSMRFKNKADGREPLRIGYVSGDFKTHPLSQYAYALFKHHNRSQFRVVALSNVPVHDKVTELFKATSDEWHDVSQMSDEAMLQLARALDLDVLVDLSGHTQLNRLSVVCQRLAPLQISAMGTAITTGLPNIDCRIVDSISEIQAARSYSSEKLLYMHPAAAVYAELDPIPACLELPADRNGFITFGYANAVSKINREIIPVWAALLRGVPNSRLEMIGCENKDTREELYKCFISAGVDSTRVGMRPRISINEYFSFFSTIDIALDPFPYTGATTTIETVLAGVPVLGKYGTRSSSRLSLVVLENIGLAEFAHADDESLISFGISLCADLPKLRKLRQEIPGRLRRSALMDQVAFIKKWETTILTEYRLRST